MWIGQKTAAPANRSTARKIACPGGGHSVGQVRDLAWTRPCHAIFRLSLVSRRSQVRGPRQFPGQPTRLRFCQLVHSEQYNSPAPPVATSSACPHPRLGCEAFQEPLPPPCLSWCPSCADPVAPLAVQFAHVIGRVREGFAVGLRTGEDVVLIRCVSDAVDERVFLRLRQLLAESVADARLLDRVAVQLRDVLRDPLTGGDGPGAAPDAIARIYGRPRVLRYACHVAAPRPAAAASDWQRASRRPGHPESRRDRCRRS